MNEDESVGGKGHRRLTTGLFVGPLHGRGQSCSMASSNRPSKYIVKPWRARPNDGNLSLPIAMGFSSDPERKPSESSQRLRSAMRAYQAGEHQAFDCIYALLAPRLRRLLISLARDEHRAEDLLQETFLQIHRARRTYDPAYPVEGWAYAIARNIFLMDYRARSRRGGRKVAPLSEAHEPAVRAHEGGVVAEDRLEKGLARLTPGRRSAVVLRHLWGWSFAEIGEALGISDRVARQRSSRGMALLRDWLRKTGGDDGD